MCRKKRGSACTITRSRPRTQKLPAYWTKQDVAEHRVISLCHLVMTLPEYQLD